MLTMRDGCFATGIVRFGTPRRHLAGDFQLITFIIARVLHIRYTGLGQSDRYLAFYRVVRDENSFHQIAILHFRELRCVAYKSVLFCP